MDDDHGLKDGGPCEVWPDGGHFELHGEGVAPGPGGGDMGEGEVQIDEALGGSSEAVVVALHLIS